MKILAQNFIGHVFASSLLVATAVGAAEADTVLDKNAAGIAITTYWESEEYKTQIADAVGHVPRIIFNKCDTSKTDPVAVFFLDQFVTDDAGKLKSGGWTERYGFSGCGNDSSLNFIFVVNQQQKIIVYTALPGESRSSIVLQRDTLVNVRAAVGIHVKPACESVIIVNTNVGTIENKQLARVDPTTVSGKAIWNEVWTADACGKKLLVPIEFIPDSLTKPGETGTSFVVHATDIVDL